MRYWVFIIIGGMYANLFGACFATEDFDLAQELKKTPLGFSQPSAPNDHQYYPLLNIILSYAVQYWQTRLTFPNVISVIEENHERNHRHTMPPLAITTQQVSWSGDTKRTTQHFDPKNTEWALRGNKIRVRRFSPPLHDSVPFIVKDGLPSLKIETAEAYSDEAYTALLNTLPKTRCKRCICSIQ